MEREGDDGEGREEVMEREVMEKEGGDGEREVMERGCELPDVLGALHAWQGGNLEQSR